VSYPLFASAYPQAWRSMCGCALNASLAAMPARSIMCANPAVVNGAPRSDVKTKGDFGSYSRWARSSSPRIGWVLGVPCLTLRTCRVAVREVHLISAILPSARVKAHPSVPNIV
jgi:hypothetical protein